MQPETIAAEGRIWKFGDNLSTDQILPSRFMTMVKPQELAANCLAGADPGFAGKVQTGDIVVAGINDEEATIKTLRRQGSTVILVPANESMAPIELPGDEVVIYGKVVSVLRRL